MNRLRAVVVAAVATGVLLPGVAAHAAAPHAAPYAAPHAAPGPAEAPEYWFDAWHVEQLWSAGARGQGITIAEIDTGVNAQVPELAGRIVPGHDFGTGGDGRIDHEVSTFGHGTAMASIMVGAKGILGITGTAPDARVMPVAVPLNGTTGAGSDDHLSSAIRWSADHGGKIISMSLGGTRNPSTDKVPCPVAEQEAVYYALSKGSIVLAAVGNNGQTTNAVEEPGVCLGVVSVGAVDQNGVVAPFSSRHPYLTMTAPGVAIASLSRVPGAAYSGDGTSQATALASAAMALVWSKYPTLTGRQVLTRVLATLDRRRAKADPAYGYGMINPFRAVYNNVPAGTVNPVFAGVDPFLTRFTAFQDAAQAPRPNPAPARSKSVGSYRVGNAPRLFAPRVLQGLTIAGIGLLAILALTLLAWVSRRRPVGVPRESRAAPAAEPETPDATGLVWHNIIDAEEPAARQRDG